MSIELQEELEHEFDHMDDPTCPLVLEIENENVVNCHDLGEIPEDCPVLEENPLVEILRCIQAELGSLNPICSTTNRSSIQCIFPSLPNVFIPYHADAPIFQLKVDLFLFRCLLWYKGFTDGHIKHFKVNKECAFLLKSVQFIHARNSSGATLEDAYIQHLNSLSLNSEKIAMIRQRIKTSLFQKFTKSLESTDMENIMNTLLNAIGAVPPSIKKFSQVPLQEGDIFSFYGVIYTDIPDVSKYSYRIDLYLTESPQSVDYNMTSESAVITDTLIMLPRPFYSQPTLRTITRAYIPSNLTSNLYKTAVLSLYHAETMFSEAIHAADQYYSTYLTTGNYVFEMYAIYIWANITLYYHVANA